MILKTITLGEMIENNVNIFDFNYPFHLEEYRNTFEQHFIDYYYYDEIGQETVARFKHRLKIKFNLIMPYWNKFLIADNLEQRILDNYDVTETFTRNIANDTIATNESTNKNLESETPVQKTDLEMLDYFSSIQKNIGNNTSKANGNSKEDWSRTMKGNIGIQTDADAIVKYWDTIRKLEMEIIKDCEDLFMGVY